MNIYLDNAAATKLHPEVKKEVRRGLGIYGNPSSYNNIGRKAAEELYKARLKVARFLNARPEEIIFTSSGSEANNMAIMCSVFAGPTDKTEIITSPTEHPSVLEPVAALKRGGKKTRYVKVDGKGVVDVEDIASKISDKTLLVSIMYANNEIGTIGPVVKLGKLVKELREGGKYPLFHVDACQAAGYLDMDVNHLGVDLLTFNGSKINGPRGAGVLYVRKGTPMSPYIMGGDQERGLRAGTENLPAILGLAKAVELIDRRGAERLSVLRDYFFTKIKETMPDLKINGVVGKDRLPNNINISIPGLDSENLLLELDKYGISAGSGSACTARSVEPSHVLKAIGVEKKYLSGALRFSMGRQTTKKDMDYVLKVLPDAVQDLRKRYQK